MLQSGGSSILVLRWLIIADQGKEFVGTQFKEFTNANSILLHIIDVRAPWQNGRTERHGDIYKKIFERARWMHSPSSSVALQRLAMECNAAKNRLSNRSGYSPLQRVFGIGHRLPADLTSDDVYGPDPVYDLAATDASFEESRQIREAAMKAHAEVSIRDRIEDSVRARPRTQTVLRADDVIMVWKTNPPSKRGRWVGPGVCIGTHRGSVVGQHARISVEVQPASVQTGYHRRVSRFGDPEPIAG